MLQGLWIPVLLEKNGLLLPEAKVRLRDIRFCDDRFTLSTEDDSDPVWWGSVVVSSRLAATYTYSVNMRTKPCRIDLQELPPKTKGKPAVLKGIFTLYKNEMRFCLGADGQERPSEFRSAKDGPTLYILKRYVP
jgi:uncharacterized protein (TIGR03067 family)